MGFSEGFGGQSRDREGDTKDFKGQRPIEQRVPRDQPEVMESTQGQRGQAEVSSYPETRTVHLGPFWEEQPRDGDPQGSSCPVGVGRLTVWLGAGPSREAWGPEDTDDAGLMAQHRVGGYSGGTGET